MNRWILKASVLFLAANVALACGDDEDDGNTAAGGSSGKGGSGGKGGTSSSGGSAGQGEGGRAEPVGGSGGEAPVPVTCEAPTPPSVGGGEGGAGGGAEVGGGGSESTPDDRISIEGRWVDEFDGEHVITSATWKSGGSLYNISQYDNEEFYVIARNDEGNMYSPCAWSRFDWTYDGDDLYFCQSAYAAESEEAALDVAADPSDLEHGCGNDFAWSKLTPQ